MSCRQQRQRVELHGTHFPVRWLFLVFIGFSLLRMVLVPVICFRLVPFQKAIMGSVLMVFSQLWFAFNMCQCSVSISSKFGNSRLCYWQWYALFIMFIMIELVNLLNLLYDNTFFVSFINKLPNKFSRVAVVVLECWTYSSYWNYRKKTTIRTAWLKGILLFFNECGCSDFVLWKFWRSLDFRKRVACSLFCWSM